jgi:hypothetical protein
MPMTHLPQVPEYLVNIAQDLISTNTDGDSDFTKDIDHSLYLNRWLDLNDGSRVQSRSQRGIMMPQIWDDWVKANITQKYIETSIRVSEGNSTTHGAHCDFRRKWKLYYLLSRGGDNATTYFYRQKGHPIVRDEITDNDTRLISVTDYSELEVIDSVQWPINQWVLLNTMILHGVEGITGLRSNFTVGIPPDYSLLFN